MRDTHVRSGWLAACALAAAIAMPWPMLAQGGFNGPGQYEITNIKSGKVIDLNRGDGSSVTQFQPMNRENQFWNIREAEPGFWFIRNARTGTALEAMGPANSIPVRAMPFTGAPPQQWQIVPAKDGNALIVNRVGKALDIPSGSLQDGVPVQTYDVNDGANQRFVFRQVGGGGPDVEPGSPRRRQGRPPETMQGPPPGQPGPPSGPPPGTEPGMEDQGGPPRREWSGEVNGGRLDGPRQMYLMDGDGACFYRQEHFRGRAFCVRVGEDVRHMPEDWSEGFASVRFFGRVHRVVVYGRPEFAGRRARIDADVPEVAGLHAENGEPLRRIGSVRVY